MSEFLTELEGYPGLEGSIIRVTKIHKVLKQILKLSSIPLEEQYHFKDRSRDLLAKWNDTLNNDPAGAGDKEDGAGGKDGEEPKTPGLPAAATDAAAAESHNGEDSRPTAELDSNDSNYSQEIARRDLKRTGVDAVRNRGTPSENAQGVKQTLDPNSEAPAAVEPAKEAEEPKAKTETPPTAEPAKETEEPKVEAKVDEKAAEAKEAEKEKHEAISAAVEKMAPPEEEKAQVAAGAEAAVDAAIEIVAAAVVDGRAEGVA